MTKELPFLLNCRFLQTDLLRSQSRHVSMPIWNCFCKWRSVKRAPVLGCACLLGCNVASSLTGGVVHASLGNSQPASCCLLLSVGTCSCAFLSCNECFIIGPGPLFVWEMFHSCKFPKPGCVCVVGYQCALGFSCVVVVQP